MLTNAEKLTVSKELEKEIIEWRRHMHAHPELSFEEYNTSDFIYNKLSAFPNLELSRPTKTSVVAILKGDKPGKVLGFRADMDALPIQEETDLPFASVNDGVMHACGHDGHTAMLLGAAKLLSEQKSSISGEIRFFFQHAEELLPGGAREMVAEGVTEGLDLVYGLHLMSPLPQGKMAIVYGPATSNSDMFELVIQGKGGHSSQPENTVDPVVISAHIITALQSIVSRNTSPKDKLVVSLTTLHAGVAKNVIPEKVTIGGSVRSFDQDVRKNAVEAIERIAKGVTEAHGATYALDYTYGYDSVVNDQAATEIAESVIAERFGQEAVVHADASMGGEDFSAFSNVVPGCFIPVGAGNVAEGITAPHHHPRFMIDEASLADGTNVFLGLAEKIVME